MKWPDVPTCHGDVSSGGVFNFLPPSWTPADPYHVYPCDHCGYGSRGPYGYPFRTCSHCGSINLEDFADWCRKGSITLGGSDWKYGYPHKFYVEGIPNPFADEEVSASSTFAPFDHEPMTEDIKQSQKRIGTNGSITKVLPPGERGSGNSRWTDQFWRVCVHGRDSAPRTSFAKLYTAHLEDEGYDDEARSVILKLVSERSGIEFFMEGGKLMYRAPHFGYQRA
jgi:hypothetical protein